VNFAKSRSPKTQKIFSCEKKEEIVNIIGILGANYGRILREIEPIINKIADVLTQQRDRLMHKGRRGYSRSSPDISVLSGYAVRI
jgi:phosphoenolpyruvate carboxylase